VCPTRFATGKATLPQSRNASGLPERSKTLTRRRNWRCRSTSRIAAAQVGALDEQRRSRQSQSSASICFDRHTGTADAPTITSRWSTDCLRNVEAGTCRASAVGTPRPSDRSDPSFTAWVAASDCTYPGSQDDLMSSFHGIAPLLLSMVVSGTAIWTASLPIRPRATSISGRINSARTSTGIDETPLPSRSLAGVSLPSGNVRFRRPPDSVLACAGFFEYRVRGSTADRIPRDQTSCVQAFGASRLAIPEAFVLASMPNFIYDALYDLVQDAACLEPPWGADAGCDPDEDSDRFHGSRARDPSSTPHHPRATCERTRGYVQHRERMGERQASPHPGTGTSAGRTCRCVRNSTAALHLARSKGGASRTEEGLT
jgi:hypothetical protein